MIQKILVFIRESDSFKMYFYNTSWAFIEKTIRIAFSLIISILLARYLGPEDFGLLSFAISFVSLSLPISNLGFDSILVKEFVGKEVLEEQILGTSLVLRSISTFIISLILYIAYFIFLVDPETTNMEIWVVSILFIANFFHISNIMEFYFQSKVMYKYVAFSLSFSIFISSLLRGFLIFIKSNLLFFALSYLVEFSLLALSYVYFAFRKKLRLRTWSFNKRFAKKILLESWPLVLAGIMVTIYMKIDQLMLKSMLGNLEVGYYSSAIRLTEFFYFIPIAVSRSLNPLLVKNFNQSEDFYEHRLKVIMGLNFWGFLILAIILHYFSIEIITLLYGDEFLVSANVLKIHGYAGMSVGMGVFLAQRYVLKLTTFQSLIGTIIGAVINILLNMLLIPKMGITGAAWATLISYHCPSLFIAIIFDRKIGLMTLESPFYLFYAKKYSSLNKD